MKKKEIKEIPIEAMEKLAKVMNDSPTIAKLGNTEFAITGLKPGTQRLIAEESCKIVKAEKANFKDVIKQFSINVPTVARIIVLAILNDKDRIYKDYKNKIYSDEYDAMVDTMLWETDVKDWLNLLVEIMEMLSLDYFFDTTNAIGMIREMALGRKMKMEEQKSSLVAQSMGR